VTRAAVFSSPGDGDAALLLVKKTPCRADFLRERESMGSDSVAEQRNLLASTHDVLEMG
jgi:hypothetical protein